MQASFHPGDADPVLIICRAQADSLSRGWPPWGSASASEEEEGRQDKEGVTVCSVVSHVLIPTGLIS